MIQPKADCNICGKYNYMYERKAGVVCMECCTLMGKIEKYQLEGNLIKVIEFVNAEIKRVDKHQ